MTSKIFLFADSLLCAVAVAVTHKVSMAIDLLAQDGMTRRISRQSAELVLPWIRPTASARP